MTFSENSNQSLTEGQVSIAMAEAEDPCDVVEEVIPALVIGDLSELDLRAVVTHCETCNSCTQLKDAWAVGLAEPELPPESAIPEPGTALGLRPGHYGLMESPVGDLLIVVTGNGVADVSYLAHHGREDRFAELEQRGIIATERSAQVAPVRDQLQEYFDAKRKTFHLPIDLHGVTSFTRSVLEATSAVPFGDLRTYKGIATAIGKPSASRAVGNALGRNPIPVIVPCHRVVLSNGTMGWYTGGPDIKKVLLDIEGVSFAGSRTKQAQRELPGLR